MSTVTGQAWEVSSFMAKVAPQVMPQATSTVHSSQHTIQQPATHETHKTKMTLTTRGKAVLSGIGVVALLLVGMGVWNGNVANSASSTQEVTSYVVRPGDTLWSYAQESTKPGEDVRETVQELIELNNLDSSAVTVGQRLVVPID